MEKESLVMKKCPFCGADAEIRKTIKNKGSNHTGNVPEGAELVRTVERKSVYISRKMYYWERKGFIIKCSNKDCIGHSLGRVFASEKEAVAEWNRRICNCHTEDIGQVL